MYDNNENFPQQSNSTSQNDGYQEYYYNAGASYSQPADANAGKKKKKSGFGKKPVPACLWRDGRRGIQRSSLPKRQGIKSGKSCA